MNNIPVQAVLGASQVQTQLSITGRCPVQWTAFNMAKCGQYEIGTEGCVLCSLLERDDWKKVGIYVSICHNALNNPCVPHSSIKVHPFPCHQFYALRLKHSTHRLPYHMNIQLTRGGPEVETRFWNAVCCKR
jgi:hypothetical protein